MLLEVKKLKKVYTSHLGNIRFQALSSIDLTVDKGEFVSIMGESGSGKTTLLNLIGTLDKATSGEILLEGTDIGKIKDNKIAEFRRNNLGFIFQDYNLLDTFTVKNNILLPLVLSEKGVQLMEERVKKVTKLLEIDNLIDKYPYEISGGQKQRVAIARAIITQPKILLADEPTGALDSKSAASLLQILRELNRQAQTILMVTHSVQAASNSNRVLFIKDGIVFNQVYRGNMRQSQFYEKILNALSMNL